MSQRLIPAYKMNIAASTDVHFQGTPTVPIGATLSQQTMATPIYKDPLCDFSKFLSSGHNKLWLPTSTNNLSVTSQMLFRVPTTNNDFPNVVSCGHNKL